MNAKPISVKPNEGCGTLGLTLFGSVFLFAGLTMSWFFWISPLWSWHNAKAWKTATANIIDSRIERHDSDDGPKFTAEFEYEYSVEGLLFKNDRYDFLNTQGNRSSAQKLIAKYPIGTELKIHFDPNNPQNSVIDREVDLKIENIIFPSIFVLAGLAVCVGPLFFSLGHPQGEIERQEEVARGELALDQSGQTLSLDEMLDQQFAGPQKLKPEQSLKLAASVVVGFTVIWTGGVGFVVRDFLFRNFDWFEFLFMVPFGLGAIVLIGISIYLLLSLFNPKVEIAISNGAVPLGQAVNIAWEIKGRSLIIDNLAISVIGEEKATYVEGTDKKTDLETFHTIKILGTSEPALMQFGTKTISIPPDSMHSFKAEHNEISWSVEVHGEIPWWPDINSKMPFRVKPT
ncbi:MAG: DUF3592 domain-containing protein [Planctomycetota bacterium]